ncbi:SAM-dependent methyltransferase [Mycobacterium sp. 94-17]|uniref:SAM-dependent methyltransferase n=1 Tax=Mycobacterium sp. 94-17 TaxID=2986147 RepID=UPI002D1F6158|nr:SAM-dependent methyltransferase [Mycobacterium sp. 94-17]MEB4210176.1 SAM-dependent methyltransferase [Mycobacterium sp. 94-17]
MTARLPDGYFDDMYVGSRDPWQLSTRWYEHRKYAITLGLLPQRRYRHGFEPGCSIGTLTTQLAQRCDHLTAVDVAEAALRGADTQLREAGCRERVTLIRSSLDAAWPSGPFDLLVLSEVAYYLQAETLAEVLLRECPRLAPGANVVAAHWRHPVADYPLTGDAAHDVIADTPGLSPMGRYRDSDVVIDVFDTGDGRSVAAREGVPGAR